MTGLRDHMSQFKDSYLSEDHSHMFVKLTVGQIQNGLFRGCREVYSNKNDQNEVQSVMDRRYDQTAYEKTPETLPSCSKVK